MEKSFLFTDVTNPTWLVYVAFLVIAVFFRFSRFLTIRNLDLTLLLLLSTAIVVAGVYRDKVWVPPVAVEDSASPSEPGDGPPSAATSVTSTELATENSASPGPFGQTSSDAATDADAAKQPDNQASAVISADASIGDLPSSDSSDANAKSVAVNDPQQLPSVDLGNGPRSHPIYTWASIALMGLTIMLIVRLIFDESLTRRPRLDQNLNQAGITFLCIPAFAILMVSVLTNNPEDSTFKAVEHGRALLERRDVQVDPQTGGDTQPVIPATPALWRLCWPGFLSSSHIPLWCLDC